MVVPNIVKNGNNSLLAFTTNSGLYSESLPSKPTQPLNHERALD